MTETSTPTREEWHRRRREAREWYGMLSIENAEDVFYRIKTLLDGRRYTWVSYNTEQPHSRPDVRTGQRLDPTDGVSLRLDREPLSDGRPWAHIWAHDTYGVWGFTSAHATEAEAYADQAAEKKTWTYVVIDGFGDGSRDHLMIEQFNGYGQLLRWVITPEYVSAHERAEQEAAVLEAAARRAGEGWQRPEGRYSWERGLYRPEWDPCTDAVNLLEDMAEYVREFERPLTEIEKES